MPRGRTTLCQTLYTYLLLLINFLSDFVAYDYVLMQVVRVRASHRTGESNFMLALRTSLAKHYGTQPVGLGGVFVIEKGKAKIHVMVNIDIIFIKCVAKLHIKFNIRICISYCTAVQIENPRDSESHNKCITYS